MVEVFVCPECSSNRLYRDGIRYLADGTAVQRFLCRTCGYRFSEKSKNETRHKRLSDAHGEEALAMEAQKELERRDAGAAEQTIKKQDVIGKLLLFAWHLKKKGRSQYTIQNYMEMLRLLIKNGADLYDPEAVKETLAKLPKTISWKHHAVCAYSAFLDFLGLKWEKPNYKRQRKLPFIPLEGEINALIAASGKKTAAFLQLLKETGMRAGEALRLKWVNIDFERRIIMLNEPEKGSEPRVWRVSNALLGMLNILPRKNEKVFPSSYHAMKHSFIRTRRKLAHKLNNPRLLQISFHTFRHWKATMEYHKTRDPLYVKQLLGHKKLDTTLLYIQVEKAIFQEAEGEFTVKVAKTPEEIKDLLTVGFDYICEKDGLVFLRKRR